MTDAPHDIDFSAIIDRDEIDDGMQLCFVWCRTHCNYEWHWLQTVKSHRKPQHRPGARLTVIEGGRRT